MKKVLLLGDSIRECYQEKVVEKIGEGYKIFYPNENCRFSAFTLNSLRYWFEYIPKDIDVIHWNNGLWDTAFINGEDTPFISVDEYIGYMQRILNVLRKECPNAKIILATITPTRKEKEYKKESRHFVGVISRYNDKLLEALRNQVDGINDLYNVVLPEVNEMICDDYIHLNEYGKEKCAASVIQAIKRLERS